jgi:hypothetical protein
MGSECYICGRDGQQMGRVKKVIFRDLEQNITSEEYSQVNGQDSVWAEGYYTAIFESGEEIDVFQCENCVEEMLQKAKRNSIIAGIVAALLLSAAIANLVFHFLGTIVSIVLFLSGAVSGLVMIIQISKAGKKNINTSAIDEFVSKKNAGNSFSDFFDLGVGSEKKKFKPGTELFAPVEDLDSFEKRGSEYYVIRIPFTTGDWFDYDLWKKTNSVP